MSELDDVRLSDRTKAVFEAARDTGKQILTLTTAILTLTVAFHKDVSTSRHGLWLLGLSWVAFLFSILAGVAGMLALTGSLDPKKVIDEHRKKQPAEAFGRSIYRPNIQLCFGAQLALFLFGLLVFVTFGAANL